MHTIIGVVKNWNSLNFLQIFCRIFYNANSKDQNNHCNMNNLEDSPQTSQVSDQAQSSTSDPTVFKPSPHKRARIDNVHDQSSSNPLSATNSISQQVAVDPQAENQSVSESAKPPASQSQSLSFSSL
jgi:hypothetical protein